MFGFLKNKESSSHVETPEITDFERLSAKCKTLAIDTSKFLIPMDLNSLSDLECDLLYTSWKTEFIKTSLMSHLVGDYLSYFRNDLPDQVSKLQELIDTSAIKELTILVDCPYYDNPVIYTYQNNKVATGLDIKYNAYVNGPGEVEIKNSENIVVLDLSITEYVPITALESHDKVSKIIPGNWISEMSNFLMQAHMFKEEENRRWTETVELERAAEKRTFISEAIDLN